MLLATMVRASRLWMQGPGFKPGLPLCSQGCILLDVDSGTTCYKTFPPIVKSAGMDLFAVAPNITTFIWNKFIPIGWYYKIDYPKLEQL